LVLLSDSNIVKNNNNTVAAAAADTISIVCQQASNHPKVKLFLDTIDRNSLKTKKYETDLVHFKNF
jgi:peptide deformylase